MFSSVILTFTRTTVINNNVNNAHSWTALFTAFRCHQQPSAYLTIGILQLDKHLRQTGQTLMACTVAEAF